MMKRICLSLFLSSFILLTSYLTCATKNTDQFQSGIPALIREEENSNPVRENGDTVVFPENLCPFSVEVYPEALYVGDPLYIRMKFENNTDGDVYAYAHSLSRNQIETNIVAYYFKETAEFIPWSTFHAYRGPMFVSHAWQKLKSGEKGLTQYSALGFPGVNYKIRQLNSDARTVKKRWEEIRNMPPLTCDDEGFITGITTGQLVVVINNGGMYYISEDASTYGRPPKLLRTLMVASSPIVLKVRDQSEMNVIDEILSKPGVFEKDDLEHLVQKLTPGTLQNLLKYQLLFLELSEGIGDELNEVQIHETLGKLEVFLKPLHEIERENLKRFVENREWLERRMRNNEILLKKFVEVFGVKPVPIGNVGGMDGGI